MPLFELDESGARLVRPMQPAATSFEPDSSALVTEHLSDLLGEGLFPVSVRRSSQDSGPHMLALDVVGQPVVVEVVAELDSDALIQALNYAGQAGRLTSGELASLYHAGAEQFGVDLVGFRESLPAAYSRRGLRVGARLLLVCSSVNPEIADALEFLRAPGRQVEVLQMGVIHGAGGRRYLDVSPLAGPIAEMRQVEQASLRLVRSKDAFAAAMAYDEQRKAAERFAAAPEDETSGRSPFAATGTDGHADGIESGTSAASATSGPTPIVGTRTPEASPVVSPMSPAVRSAGLSAGLSAPTGVGATPAAGSRGTPAPSTGGAPLAGMSPTPPTPPTGGTTPPRTSAFAPPPGAPSDSRAAVSDASYTPVFVPAPGGPLIPPDARPLTEEPDALGGHPVTPSPTPLPPTSLPPAAIPSTPLPPTAPTAPAPPPHAPDPPPGTAAPSPGHPVPSPSALAPSSGHHPAPSPSAPAPSPSVHSDLAPSAPVSPASRDANQHPASPPLAPSTGAHPLGLHGTTSHRTAPGRGAAKTQQPNESLAAIGRTEGPLELVWLRERRGQRLTATLRADGLIELPSGEVFGDPDAAAQTASHAALSVDGWGVWRVGDGGLTLRQVVSAD